MCEGSNGESENAIIDHTQVCRDGNGLQEGASEPFEPFVCQICIDIAYKPIVLQACGHVFCFWCIRRSMNERKPSQCPACRRPYLHFPRVCRLLHFLLEKAWPLHYGRKASETLAMEQATAVFSPRILRQFRTTSSCSSDQEYSLSTPSSSSSSSAGHFDRSSSSNAAAFDSRGHKLHVYPELAMDAAESTPTVGVGDVSCSVCRDLLYRPVVMNCGEAMCEGCWKGKARRGVTSSSPQWCGCGGGGGVHRRGSDVAHVCLALHHFLERSFSSLYSQRSLHTTTCTPTVPEEKKEREPNDLDDDTIEEDDGFVHVGVGCDGCGMFPIITRNRYHCVECEEQVGYDLCQNCYDLHAYKGSFKADNASELDKYSKQVVEEDKPSTGDVSPMSELTVGRFNQQHNKEHQLVAMVSAQRARPATFGVVLGFQRRQVAPLQFDLHSGTIARRRRSQQLIMEDFDDYIDNLV
ncbi:hypothetical protein L7F22_063505 [Adiantum nelumboides]|nr:hypothetical protein [Adiantum nelumboides]